MSVAPDGMHPERLAFLRGAVKERLKQLGLHEQLDSILAGQHGNEFTQEDLLAALKESGLINSVLTSFRELPVPDSPLQTSHEKLAQGTAAAIHNAACVVQIRPGRSFLEYLDAASSRHRWLQVSVEMFGNRAVSEVVPCAVEPKFGGMGVLPLPAASAEPLALLPLRYPLHVVCREVTAPVHQWQDEDMAVLPVGLDPEAGSPSVVGVCSIDWRRALTWTHASRTHSFYAELTPPGSTTCATADASPCVGVVEISLQIKPAVTQPFALSVLQGQTALELSRDADVRRQFSERVKKWWQAAVQRCPAVRTRVVKAAARDEDGQLRPVPAFVRPLQLGRGLSSPASAARFVALLSDRLRGRAERGPGSLVAQGAVEAWAGLHTVLASGAASADERALLLCSLLLGFGLDAYVCMGRGVDGAHLWVLTRSSRDATFWDPETGEKQSLASLQQSLDGHYGTVSCAFNNCVLYANILPSEEVATVALNFEDPNMWARLNVDPVTDVPGPCWSPIALQLPLLAQAEEIELRLENLVRAGLAAYRSTVLGTSSTQWDEGLEHVLMQALEGYEHSARVGVDVPWQDEFHQAVQQVTPRGSVFKASPLHFSHCHPQAIVSALVTDAVGQEIVRTDVADMVLAVRVKVFAYPENVLSVWCILATRFVLHSSSIA